MSLKDYIGQKIREMRLERGGISQETLAKAIGVATNTVSRWETGTYETRVDDLDNLARYFKVSVMDFLPQEEQSAQIRISALMRAAQDLPDTDLKELQKYAEYRRARFRIATTKTKKG